MDPTFWTLINQLQELSPTVWNIALQQVEAQGQGRIMWRVPAMIIFAAMLLMEINFVISWLQGYNYDREAMLGPVILWTVALIAAACIIIQSLYIDVAMMKQNPEYYAIKIIINTLK